MLNNTLRSIILNTNQPTKYCVAWGALTAKRNYPDFKKYFERKLAEGKNKMLIVNNIRNKLILRVASVIKNNKLYEVQMAA